MDSRRTHDILTSLAVSAMLTSAILSTAPGGSIAAGAGPQPQTLVNALSALGANGFHGIANVAIPEIVATPSATPAVAPAAPTKPLSDAQIRKMIVLMNQYSKGSALDTNFSRALGLTTGDQVLTIKLLRYHHGDSPFYYFSLLPNEQYLFVLKPSASGTTVEMFLTDKDQNLLAAVSGELGKPAIAIPIPDAQAKLRAELETWSNAIGPADAVASTSN